MSGGHMPAYPAGDYSCGTSGLTKRELFAAMAMQGILSGNPASSEDFREHGATFAGDCVMLADALLAALAEPPA